MEMKCRVEMKGKVFNVFEMFIIFNIGEWDVMYIGDGV